MESIEDFVTVVYPNIRESDEKNFMNVKDIINIAIKSLEKQNLIVNDYFILDEILFIINEMEKAYYANFIFDILSIFKDVGEDKIIIQNYVYDSDENPRFINVNYNGIKFNFSILTFYFNLFKYEGNIILNPFQNYVKSKNLIYADPNDLVSNKLLNEYGLILNYEENYGLSISVSNVEKFEIWKNGGFIISTITPESYPMEYDRKSIIDLEENFNLLTLREPLHREIMHNNK
jgi:hypothetical protein